MKWSLTLPAGLFVLLAIQAPSVAAPCFAPASVNRPAETQSVEELLLLADTYARDSSYREAIRYAERAFQQASSEGRVGECISALEKQGRIWQAQQHWRKARDKYEAACKLAQQGAPLATQIRILQSLRQLALLRGKDSEVATIDRKLGILQGEIDPTSTQGQRKKAQVQEESRLLAIRLSEINKANQRLDTISRQLSMEKNKWNSEKRRIDDEIATFKKSVAGMTELQAKTSLLLVQQRIITNALTYQKQKDSLMLSQNKLELQRQQAEIELQRTKSKLLICIFFIALAATGVFFWQVRVARKHNEQLAQKNAVIAYEQQRAESLLLNILPVSIVEELKEKGTARTRHYNQVSVLFADIKGFTQIAEQVSAQELVEALDYCFKGFDAIVEHYRIEKIKTIGDAYMCASGLAADDPDHAVRMVKAALAMQQFAKTWKYERLTTGKPVFEIRIGIHTGPVVAGVVGNKKFSYDIWGDTVNVAARIESSGENGEINLSKSTYELIKSHFNCFFRGEIPAKNKGNIAMYFIENQLDIHHPEVTSRSDQSPLSGLRPVSPLAAEPAKQWAYA